MSWLTREIIPSRRRGALSERLSTLLGGGAILMSLVCWSPTRIGVVTGHSMEPTLQPGSAFLYVREDPEKEVYRPGDVVVVRMAGDLCVKRVFKVGGDRFWTVACGPRLEGENISPVDSQPPIGQWRKRFPRFRFCRYQVPPGTLFLLGDSPWSCDSRQLGPVPVGNVVGRVVAPRTPEPEEKPYLCWMNRPDRRIRRAGRRLASDV